MKTAAKGAKTSPSKSKDDSLPAFDNPPVYEVVTGVTLHRLENLHSHHIGLIWDAAFKEDFPEVSEQPPLAVTFAVDQPVNLMLRAAELPRVWFSAPNGGDLIQIQRDRFIFNWRKKSESDTYPRFDFVQQKFWSAFNAYATLLEKFGIGKIQPVALELSYLNLIDQNAGWSTLAHLATPFLDKAVTHPKEAMLQTPTNYTWSMAHQLPDNMGHLTIALQSAVRLVDQKPVLRFDLSCQGSPPNLQVGDFARWFDLARKWIVRSFAELTSAKAQEKNWKRTR